MAEADELQERIDAAREDIQKVVSFLVNRFGREADVFAHLNSALRHLREAPPPRQEKAVAVEEAATAEPEEEVESIAPPLEEPVVVAEAVAPKGAHRGRRGRTKRT